VKKGAEEDVLKRWDFGNNPPLSADGPHKTKQVFEKIVFVPFMRRTNVKWKVS